MTRALTDKEITDLRRAGKLVSKVDIWRQPKTEEPETAKVILTILRGISNKLSTVENIGPQELRNLVDALLYKLEAVSGAIRGLAGQGENAEIVSLLRDISDKLEGGDMWTFRVTKRDSDGKVDTIIATREE